MQNLELVSRHLVSKKFQCRQENSNLIFDYNKLIDMVNYWKAIFLEKHELRTGDKIGLGYSLIDIFYFGALLAASEIGLRVVILDDLYNKSKVSGYYPLDLFVRGPSLKFDGVEDIEKNSLRTEDSSIFDTYYIQFPEKFNQYVSYMCDPNNIVMSCTSSGTTDTPKLINHTHKFIYEVAKRNSQLLKFEGNVCHVKSLHHGSSLSTYFLPALMSDRCKEHHIYPIKTREQVDGAVDYFLKNDINFVQLSYRKDLELFLLLAVKKQVVFKNLVIHTLGYIDPSWQPLLKKLGQIKIISIFGSNETSGPIMTNELLPNSEDFDPKKFFVSDKFYTLTKTENNQLAVTLPTYENTQVIMQDSFRILNNEYYHLGRSDIFRIGETSIDANWFLTLTQCLGIDGDLVFDKMKQKIYYANWDYKNANANLDKINQQLKSKYNVEISKWKTLDPKLYLYGIKIDHDMIREAFRNEI
jgi:hypothetical protein